MSPGEKKVIELIIEMLKEDINYETYPEKAGMLQGKIDIAIRKLENLVRE